MWEELGDKEKKILKIIQEYLNDNKVFEIEKIITYIIARFRLNKININKEGIKIAIDSLIDKNYIVEGSKLSREDILDNPTRLKIFLYVLKNPGCYFNKIINELNIPNNVGIWHINMLLKFRFIKSGVFLNHDLYYFPTLDFKKVKLIHFLSKKRTKRIISHLKDKINGINKTKISEELNMHPNTVTKYLDILESFKLVKKKKVGRSIMFSLTTKIDELKLEI
ncbi:MAG: hypothetical protein EU548_06290 [Promethearchaeota archaeon]|nr:MAG: hypothetical protein EU548_06290 [Candidatus Lokiarchaeota archaeon]